MESYIALEIGEIYHSHISAGGEENTEKRTASILPRLAGCDSRAIAEFMERYGDFVWNLAKKQIRFAGETEDAVCEIFQDIWKSAHLFDAAKHDEQKFVAFIALRRLLKKKSAADGSGEVF